MIYFNVIIVVASATIIFALIVESTNKQNKYKEKVEQEKLKEE
jgi:hypothetical protein